MIGHLYRYPHPHYPNKFIYVGQGPNRDKDHRRGTKDFGKRFKRDFPNDDLPKPIREQIEVSDHADLNFQETIWMFRYHTWLGYGGYNLTFPGDTDYKNMGRIGGLLGGPIGGPIGGRISGRITNETSNGRKGNGGRVVGRRAGLIQGPKNVASGLLSRICSSGGLVGGRKNVESGQMNKIRTPESCSKGGVSATHKRWHVGRGVFNLRCKLCKAALNVIS